MSSPPMDSGNLIARAAVEALMAAGGKPRLFWLGNSIDISAARLWGADDVVATRRSRVTPEQHD